MVGIKSARLTMQNEGKNDVKSTFAVEKHMELVPNCNSDRAWMWTTFADFSEEEPKEELLAIRFLNAESKSRHRLT